MKKILIALAGVLLAAAPAYAGVFEDATARYQAGKYEEAAALFEKAAIERPTAAALYDLGTSAFRAGKKGKAMLALLRARAISPRDKDIAWNLAIARDSVVGPAPAERNFLKERAETLLNGVSSDEAAAGLFLSAALFFLSAVFRFFGLRGAGFLRGVSVAGLLLAGALVSWHVADQNEPKLVITAKTVPARAGPSVKENALFTLREGAEARLLDETKDWYYAGVRGGSAGWIARASAEIV
jgi:tetratricopeptide (TPR) repeat protein